MSEGINDAGRKLIERNEGCVLHAYPDPASGGDPWTIGYGHTGPDVCPGVVIDQAQAEELLEQDLEKFEDGVLDAIEDAPVGDNQFAAMVSLAYNVGLGNFGHSSVARYHKAGRYAEAADAFRMWNKAAGRVLPALSRRRAEERALYLRDDVEDVPNPPHVDPPHPAEGDLLSRLEEWVHKHWEKKP